MVEVVMERWKFAVDWLIKPSQLRAAAPRR
jgi:hypothetical protein